MSRYRYRSAAIGQRNGLGRIGVLVAGFCMLFVAAILSSCVGDAFVFVEGRVVSAQGEALQGCELALFLEAEEMDFDVAKRRSYIEPIEPEFRTGFDISPHKKGYYFAVRCPGYAIPYRSDIYLIGGGMYFDRSGEGLDLGTVVMKE